MRLLISGAVVALCATFPLTSAFAQCPAYGADTDCGSVITITNTGATVTQTGQGPYDGSDDTLIGVVNNSTTPIYSLTLTSTADIFRLRL